MLDGRFVDLFEPITAFLKEKEITYSELDDDEWLQHLMFLTDVMEHLQTLNLQLQGKDKYLISHSVYLVFKLNYNFSKRTLKILLTSLFEMDICHILALRGNTLNNLKPNFFSRYCMP